MMPRKLVTSFTSKLPTDKHRRSVKHHSEELVSPWKSIPAASLPKSVYVVQFVPFSFDSFASSIPNPLVTVYAQLGAREAIQGVEIKGALAEDEATVGRMLYASSNGRTPPAGHPLEDLRRTLCLQDMGLREAAWDAAEPARIQDLLSKLDQNSAVYRLVKIVKLTRVCLESPKAKKAAAVERLIAQLDDCRPAERKWFTRRLLGALQRCGDRTSRRLFLQATPPEDRETPASGEVALEVVFDRSQIRRGEPCYCEVRLHNYGLEPRVVNAFSVGSSLGFRAMLFGRASELAQMPATDTRHGRGAMVGGGGTQQVELAPNAAMVTSLQVRPFSYTNHDSPVGGFSHMITTVWSTSASSLPHRTAIVGDISARPARNLVRELYVDFKDHPIRDHGDAVAAQLSAEPGPPSARPRTPVIHLSNRLCRQMEPHVPVDHQEE